MLRKKEKKSIKKEKRERKPTKYDNSINHLIFSQL